MSDSWHFGPFTLDIDNAYLWRDRQRIDLRPKIFAVLAYLVGHAGELVTKAELLEAIWPETAVGDGVLKISLVELRKVLGDTTKHPQFIETQHRRGYRFIASVTQRVSDVASTIEPPLSSLASSTATTIWPVSHQPTRRLVGREAELEQLRQLYRQAAQGARQIVFVTGEAGIGKTALVDALLSEFDDKTAVWIGRGQCLELYGAGEAYLPLFDALGQLCRLPDSAEFVTRLLLHAPSWVLQMPALLSDVSHEMLQKRQHGASPERMLRELTEAVESATAERPLVLVLEDLHWSDRATLDWIAYAARRRGVARLLVVGTFRPIDAMVTGHAVRTLAKDLRAHRLCHEVILDGWPETAVSSYLEQRFGQNDLAADLGTILHQCTHGNPLFVITAVDAMTHQAVLCPGPQGWRRVEDTNTLAALIPQSLRQLIEQELERLPPEAQAVLEAASVAGVEFSSAVVGRCVDESMEMVEN
ncbi:hypothetical protein C2W62_12395 [Candidatus Entotheonella serta]|nr:hypothetical protein C2W62_12395 [Candidatus Entotheonella serta]